MATGISPNLYGYIPVLADDCAVSLPAVEIWILDGVWLRNRFSLLENQQGAAILIVAGKSGTIGNCVGEYLVARNEQNTSIVEQSV